MTTYYLIHGLICFVLLFVIFDDLKNYRIRNCSVLLLLLATTGAITLTGGVGELAWHLIPAAPALILLVCAYSRQLVGGGDAKLIVVAFVYVGPAGSLLFAIALLLFTLAYWLAVRAAVVPFKRIGAQISVPFGPSIAGAWIVTMFATFALRSAYAH